MGGDETQKVVMVGTFSCRDGEAAAMEGVLTEMVEAAKVEPGVEVYSYHRGEGNRFWFMAMMSDDEATDQHGKTAGMRKAIQAFMPLVDEPPQITRLRPIAGIGIGL
jgi:quinol monooxygenase YgiN